MRTLLIRKSALPPELRELLEKSSKTREGQVICQTLLLRYGATRTRDLLPEQVQPFMDELKAILAGKAPHPEDAWKSKDVGSPTGRIVTGQPQIQTIPLRTPEAEKIKKAFRVQLQGKAK